MPLLPTNSQEELPYCNIDNLEDNTTAEVGRLGAPLHDVNNSNCMMLTIPNSIFGI